MDSLSPMIAPMAEDSGACPTTSDEILPQPASRLLSLPTELRLLICRSMTLSPQFVESLAWRGAYLSCRRLHQDMRNQLDPGRDLEKYIASKAQTWDQDIHSKIVLGDLHPFLGLIRDIRIEVPIPAQHHWQPASLIVLSSLYALYLDHLHVVMTGGPPHGLVYCDMKTFRDQYFKDFVLQGAVNCRKVTFTIDVLSSAEKGREKSTTIGDIVLVGDVWSNLTIVEDQRERQVERAFESKSRFKPTQLQVPTRR